MKDLALLTDLYELTMMYGYYMTGKHEEEVAFEMFFRKPPGDSGYAIVAGLEQVIEFVEAFRFSVEDIRYLGEMRLFDDRFLDLLGHLRFTGDLYAMPEGTVAFPNEPLISVRARLIEAQYLETILLNFINHQTLIATKASRVVQAAGGDPVIEMGLRRAHGPDAGLYGSRAAVIGGCSATSNVMAGKRFGIPVRGTHAHSWVMSFDDELSAFRTYARIFPHDCLLLVDTYDTLRSGVPNAIKVFQELKESGYSPVGIRLDSGDLAYLSIRARKMLDEAGFPDARIIASGDLDEKAISQLKSRGAPVDMWGVGTSLITSNDCPSLGGVYKLVAEESQWGMVPKAKISENPLKTTIPGPKKVIRLYDRSGMAAADILMLADEQLGDAESVLVYDQAGKCKQVKLREYACRELMVPVFVRGRRVYDLPDISKIQRHAASQTHTLPEEYRRLENPKSYMVTMSQGLYQIKHKLSGEIARKAMMCDSKAPTNMAGL